MQYFFSWSKLSETRNWREHFEKPRVNVILNGERVNASLLRWGTWQWCPLSLPLFSIVLELLVSKTRQGKEIKGQGTEKEEIKSDLIQTLKIPVLARIWGNWNAYIGGGDANEATIWETGSYTDTNHINCNSIAGYLPMRKESRCLYKDLYIYICSSFIY